MQTIKPIKLLVYLAVWKRPEITKLCFAGIKRLRKHPRFDIDALAVISEESMIPLCEKYDVKWVMSDNKPLGRKKNNGLLAASKLGFDYLMEIGSDDLVLNELLDWYCPMVDAGELFFGIRDIAYLESDTGACRRLISKATYGAGRMIHRSVLERMNWKLWKDELNRGLDNNSVFNLMRQKVQYKVIAPKEFPGVIDVKSDENIWRFDYFLGVEYDKNELFKRLSKQEVAMIESYVTEPEAIQSA
ncbi:MAG TPA: hypothetical protein VK508_01780 [Cyclobacteriaceae bacterium]|nr:hypothetical protein [Cyclobacteriaceae bacterium]